MKAPLLDLETLIFRPTISIDGTLYEILSPDELSVLDSQRFASWATKLEELQKAGEESPELDNLIDAVARKVLVGVPDDVVAKLSGVQKVAVAEVFIALLLHSRMKVAGATATAMGSPAIGGAFFRASSGSTEATRGDGWMTRLSRWFGRTFG